MLTALLIYVPFLVIVAFLAAARRADEEYRWCEEQDMLHD